MENKIQKNLHPKLRSYEIDPNVLIPIDSFIKEIDETIFFKPNGTVKENWIIASGKNWFDSYQKAKKLFDEKAYTSEENQSAQMIKNAKETILLSKKENKIDYSSLQWTIMSELNDAVAKSGYKQQPVWSVMLHDLSLNGELTRDINSIMLQNSASDLKYDTHWILALLVTAQQCKKDSDVSLFADYMLRKWEAWSNGYAVLNTEDAPKGKIYVYAPKEIDIRRYVYNEAQPINSK